MIFRLLLVASLFSLVGNAQAQRNYATTSAEYIFSLSQTAAADSVDVEDVLRFSGFANTGYQRHFDFGSTVGLFTGVNVRNVGMITKVDTLRLKHRAYALAVPLAVKIGNLEKRFYVAPGAEAELMFNYKVKEFVRGKKISKRNEWFSDEVTMFNPSVFMHVNMGKAGYLKFKYYLFDFLAPADENSGYRVRDVGSHPIPAYTQESKLFYVSWGTMIGGNKKLESKEGTAEPTLRRPGQRKRDI